MCGEPSMPNKSAGCVSGPSTRHVMTNFNPNSTQQEDNRQFGESCENLIMDDDDDHTASCSKGKLLCLVPSYACSNLEPGSPSTCKITREKLKEEKSLFP